MLNAIQKDHLRSFFYTPVREGGYDILERLRLTEVWQEAGETMALCLHPVLYTSREEHASFVAKRYTLFRDLLEVYSFIETDEMVNLSVLSGILLNPSVERPT